MARVDPMFGLVPLRNDTLSATGVGTRDSAYTEATPRPGVAVASQADTDWAPVVTGDQTVACEVIAIKGGFPSRATGASVAVRLRSETSDATAWRGWADPCLLTGWSAPSDYQASNFEEFTAAARSDTGVIVIVARVTGSDTDAHTWSYDPRTEAWTVRYDWGGNQGLRSPIAMAQDPNVPGRVLLWSGSSDPHVESTLTLAYYSDDSGATWSLYATGTNTVATTAPSRLCVATHPDADWLLLDGAQYASSNRGVTWDYLESHSAFQGSNTRISVTRGPRGYVYGYRTDTDNYPAVRVLTTARSLGSAATEVILVSDACDNIVTATDADGSVYAFVAQTDIQGRVYVFRSDDGGSTWTKYKRTLAGIRTVDTLEGEHDIAVWSQGVCHLIGSHDGTPANGIHMLHCGGWANVDAGATMPTTGVMPGSYRKDRLGWVGHEAELDATGICYLPFDTPANQGWTVGVGTGTASLAPAAGQGLELSCTVGQAYTVAFTLRSATTMDWMCGAARVALKAGTTADLSDCYVNAALQTGAATLAAVTISIGTDGIEVRDGATVRATATLTTSGGVDLRWQIRQVSAAAKATVWYRVVGQGTKWTRVANDVTLTNAVGAVSTVGFGHSVTGGTETSVWSFVAGSMTSDWRFGLDAVTDLDDTPASKVRGITHGRPVGGPDTAYPVPILTATGEDVSYLHVTGGPLYTRQAFHLPVGYGHPISAVNPTTSPSPRVAWRATGTTEVLLAYDQTLASWYGGALALVAVSGSFRTAVLAVDDGGGGWTNIATLDKGFSSLDYTLTGRVVTPRTTATPSITRYIHEGELVGGYFIFTTAGSPVARRIAANSGGYWRSNAGQPCRISVETVDGTETASSSGDLVCPSGVLIAYPSADTPRRYLRVQIAASQVVPADGGTDGATAAYGAGILAVGRVVGMGSEAAWEQGRTLELATRTTRQGDGAPYRRRQGPARRVWTVPWGQVDTLLMRLHSENADHVAASGGAAIGTVEDVWSSLLGVVEHGLRSGETPCAGVARLPGTSSTITDPSMWVYGLVTVDSVTLTQALGEEGTDERLAVSGLVIESIP